MNRATEAFDQFERKGHGWVPLLIIIAIGIFSTAGVVHIFRGMRIQSAKELVSEVGNQLRKGNSFLSNPLLKVAPLPENDIPTFDDSLQAKKNLGDFQWVETFFLMEQNRPDPKPDKSDLTDPSDTAALVWKNKENTSLLVVTYPVNDLDGVSPRDKRNVQFHLFHTRENGSFVGVTCGNVSSLHPAWQIPIKLEANKKGSFIVEKMAKVLNGLAIDDAKNFQHSEISSILENYYLKRWTDWHNNGHSWEAIERFENKKKTLNGLPLYSAFLGTGVLLGSLESKTEYQLVHKMVDHWNQQKRMPEDRVSIPRLLDDSPLLFSHNRIPTTLFPNTLERLERNVGRLREDLKKRILKLVSERKEAFVSKEMMEKIRLILSENWDLEQLYQSNSTPVGEIYLVKKNNNE